MTEGNLELVDVLISWAVTLPAVVAIVVYDERRLEGRRLERAWPPVSRDAAIFAGFMMGVHPLCVLVHFVRTRRSVAGVALGLVLLIAIVVVDSLAILGAREVVAASGL